MQRNPAPHGHIQPNDHNNGQQHGRRRKDDPLDHTYNIQPTGNTTRYADPQVIVGDPPRFRATCDVCPWLGPWHAGWPDGAQAADNDGTRHRNESLGAPGWGHCPDCGRRTPDDALCDEHAQAYEAHLTREDPWA